MEFVELRLRVPRLKFSLRALFAVVLVCCLFFAYTAFWMTKVRQLQAEAEMARAQAEAQRARADAALRAQQTARQQAARVTLPMGLNDDDDL